jgi:hypothetical protein
MDLSIGGRTMLESLTDWDKRFAQAIEQVVQER